MVAQQAPPASCALCAAMSFAVLLRVAGDDTCTEDDESQDEGNQECRYGRKSESGACEEGVETIATRRGEANHGTHCQQRQGIFKTTFAVPETGLPVCLRYRNQHRSDQTGGSQRREQSYCY